jgi:hypothetical protein
LPSAAQSNPSSPSIQKHGKYIEGMKKKGEEGRRREKKGEEGKSGETDL